MKEKIRVLHVLGDLGIGGIESFVMNVYRNIDKSKIQFDFLVHNIKNPDYAKEIEKFGGRIYKITRLNLLNPLKYKKDLSNFFSTHPEYKLVHNHFRGTEAIILKEAKKNNCITISHSHSIEMGKGIKGAIRNYYKKDVIRYSDYKFACSKDAGNFLFKDEDFKVIKNGIDVNNYKFNEKTRNIIRKKLGLENNLVLINVGRLATVKNQVFLLKITKKLLDYGKDVKLLLVGNGILENSLNDEAKKLGINNKVIFTGALSNVGDILQAADIFLLPSLNEGLGIAAVEAQASGLFCILSKNVPEEVSLTDKVKFLDLNSEDKWVNEILNTSLNYDRVEDYKYIINNGYDIKDTSNLLTDFYLNI